MENIKEATGNKETITEIAIKLFAEKGYDAVGVQQICEKAEITKPTLYYYFKSKQGLLEHIAEVKGQRLYSKIEAALEYKHDFINSLTQVLNAEVMFAKENPDFYNLHCVLLSSPDGSEQRTVYLSLINKIESKYQEFFALSCNEFGNMKEKEVLYSTIFHNTVIATASMVIRNKLEFNDKLAYQIIHSTVYGLAN